MRPKARRPRRSLMRPKALDGGGFARVRGSLLVGGGSGGSVTARRFLRSEAPRRRRFTMKGILPSSSLREPAAAPSLHGCATLSPTPFQCVASIARARSPVLRARSIVTPSARTSPPPPARRSALVHSICSQASAPPVRFTAVPLRGLPLRTLRCARPGRFSARPSSRLRTRASAPPCCSSTWTPTTLWRRPSSRGRRLPPRLAPRRRLTTYELAMAL